MIRYDVGDSGVGKSNIITRFARNEFNLESNTKIGVEFAGKSLVIENKVVKVQIWDTAGQERFRAITQAFYRGAVGALLIYDITKMSTFVNVEKWLKELRDNTENEMVIMLLGNNLDLKHLRQVSTDIGAQYAQQHNLSFFFEASARDGENVDLAFQKLIQEIYNLSHKQQIETPAAGKTNSDNVVLVDCGKKKKAQEGCC